MRQDKANYLAELIEAHAPGLRDYAREYVFAKSLGRRWRFDLAWPDEMLAVEIEGGRFSGGSHVRGVRFGEDCEKYNAAILLGWRVLRYPADWLDSRPIQILQEIERALRKDE